MSNRLRFATMLVFSLSCVLIPFVPRDAAYACYAAACLLRPKHRDKRQAAIDDDIDNALRIDRLKLI